MRGPLSGRLCAFVAGLLGCTLIVAALSKAFNPTEAAITIDFALRHLILPVGAQGLVPLVTPWLVRALIAVELSLGWFLVIRPRPLVLGASLALFLGFAALVLGLVVTKAPVGCGCGLPRVLASDRAGVADISRSFVFAACAAVALVLGIAAPRRSERAVRGPVIPIAPGSS
jgi:hypothetical protein